MVGGLCGYGGLPMLANVLLLVQRCLCWVTGRSLMFLGVTLAEFNL